MSASASETAIAAGRRPEALAGSPAVEPPVRPVPIAIVGATGYAGAELIRLLARHPGVRIVGLVGRDRRGVPLGQVHPHLTTLDLAVHDEVPAEAEVVFLALPHGAAAERVSGLLERGQSVVDLGPDFRLRDPADYPRWYGFEHPAPELLGEAVYGLPELHRTELLALRERRAAGRPVIVGAPGCYSTTTIVALAPLARAGLIADLVVDAKSGVSGAGRDAKPHLHFSEVNESVSAYGVFGHRHTAEIEQELGVAGVDFLPHLVPMTRGILAAGHVRPTRPVGQAELDALYAAAYADEPFVTVVDQPPATKHTLGSNEVRVFVRADERTGRVLAIGVLDNLVKGAAGQAIQAFNLVAGFPETLGLEQLPLAP
ncbi:MAG TPA: N-acetyl-gamma-glutamyl-phosphate reductase [Candidatus Limnocylindrales bacterium]|nr:N-acetyl-gamma-glutamyl-phosphate reductase [Candidatus Limnocylindrales bacterium]